MTRKTRKLRKVLALVACAVLLVSVSIMGTIAYLTSTDTATNTFTVGKVNIELDEAEVNPDGTVVEGADRVKENDYHLLPGQSYAKDPTVTVLEGSEESYIRILVKVEKYSGLKDAFNVDTVLLQNYVTGWEPAIWVSTNVINVDAEKDTAVYEFRYYTTVDAPANDDTEGEDNVVLEALFETVEIPGEIDNDHLAKLDGVEIVVTAEAIQAAGFADADAAWDAFEAK